MGEIDFAGRLDLALKALSIGRGRLAADVAVDKSVVTRWLGGVTRPSPHNLERISRAIAAHCPGFTMLDWERADADFAARLGVYAPGALSASPDGPPAPAPHSAAPPVAAPQLPSTAAPHAFLHDTQALTTILSMPFGLVEAAEKETARRAQTYCGRWRLTRLSATGKLVYVVEHALIRRRGNGLWFDHFAGGHLLSGWMLVLGNRLYAMVADEADDSFGFYLLNGVVGPRAERLDGLLTSVGSERNADPFAMILVLERAGELTGDDDDDDDDAWGAASIAGLGVRDPDTLDPAVCAAIARDFGPATLAGGGDAILRIPHERSLARGILRATAD